MPNGQQIQRSGRLAGTSHSSTLNAGQELKDSSKGTKKGTYTIQTHNQYQVNTTNPNQPCVAANQDQLHEFSTTILVWQAQYNLLSLVDSYHFQEQHPVTEFEVNICIKIFIMHLLYSSFFIRYVVEIGVSCECTQLHSQGTT